ncbi:uncharacterized protein BXZ73DRAFT_99103 [Epithele typhae]|uniref:uncharacterized protein n=1 Tax=Epithele typhae TaxID=378194 RepID=UPI0020089CEF|nr:uncharacterized protein BXZ73DRAFT_99103 [Epithele typhae]KAH9940105.1 hypothetical protein BXZ73DRAFT_99103 [Epithele typhae]
MAGLVANTPDGHARVHFVAEGEASLHFCIKSGLMDDTLRYGHSVMIVDAGGGTVDISSYGFNSTAPLVVEEVASPDCLLEGSNILNLRAEKHLRDLLKRSKYGSKEDIKSMIDYFDRHTKAVFNGGNGPSYIKVGTASCNDPRVNVRRRDLTLTSTQMLSFFRPSLDRILTAIKKQLVSGALGKRIKTVLLVGGFAASPYLYSALKRGVEDMGLSLYHPESHTSKAVAQGAMWYFLEHIVSARIMQMTYGTETVVKYNPKDTQHVERHPTVHNRASGMPVLPKAFSCILKRGTRVHETQEISHPCHIEVEDRHELDSVSCAILCYSSMLENPCWVDVEPRFYKSLCTITADTSQVARKARRGKGGVEFYEQHFKIILLCGLTELEAQISWEEGGIEKRGSAKLVYDDDLYVPS